MSGDLRKRLMELYRGCPSGKACVKSCPLAAIRELDTTEGIRAMINLSEKEGVEILQIHELCPNHHTHATTRKPHCDDPS